MNTSGMGRLWRAQPVADGPWNRLTMVFVGTTLLLAVAFGWASFLPRSGPVARFALTLSGGSELFRGGEVGGGASVLIAVSPDGSRLVYVGESQLWQRRLNQLEPEPIPGTEGASNPVLSPDGNSVAFVVQIGLKTVSLLGGPPSTVLPSGVEDSRGGVDWASGGMLYFSNTEGAIQRVPTTGGNRSWSRRTTLAPATSRWTYFPRAGDCCSPSRTKVMSRARLRWLGSGKGEARTLLSGTMARYASSGHVVYTASDGTLLAAPFDLERLEVTGPSVGLLEGVVRYGNAGSQWRVVRDGNATVRVRRRLRPRAQPCLGRA